MSDRIEASDEKTASVTPIAAQRGCGWFALIVLLPALWLAGMIAWIGVDLARRIPDCLGVAMGLSLPALIILAISVRSVMRRAPLVPGFRDSTCLVLVVGGFLLIAAALPAHLATLRRKPQKVTLGTMVKITKELENAWDSDHCYPSTLANLPTELPRRDGWGHELNYRPTGFGRDGQCPTGYFLISAGEDGIFSCDPTRYLKRDTSHFVSDLVIRDGKEWAYPHMYQGTGKDEEACAPK